MHTFVEILSPALQNVVRECLNCFRYAAFDDAVGTKGLIDYNLAELSLSQNELMSKINAYIAQYHEGHLSRCDLAINVVELLTNTEELQGTSVYSRILTLKQNLSLYLEGTVTAAKVLQDDTTLRLNEHDGKGYSLPYIAFEHSPNKSTIQILVEQCNMRLLYYIMVLLKEEKRR